MTMVMMLTAGGKCSSQNAQHNACCQCLRVTDNTPY